MKKNFVGVSVILWFALAAIARGDGQPPVANSAPQPVTVPSEGVVITAANVDRFAGAMPPGLAFAINHGLTITISRTDRIEWPLPYLAATEKYSGQVTLDDRDYIHNYVAGLPFPLINPDDPKSGVKIAYDWRWGPFIPEEASTESAQKTKAFVVGSANPDRLLADDSERDYRNENDCDRMTFIHSHANQNGASNSITFKERGDACGPERGAVIGVEYLDPARNDDMWVFIPAVRRWRQQQMRGGYPHQSCTYSCVQFGWEYAPPKTEAYTYRLIGRQPLIACLNASAESAGIDDTTDHARFGRLQCEVRHAYVLDMQPREKTPESLIAAKVYVDAETFLYLGAEFFRDGAPDADFPIWSRRRSENGDTQLVLANDFYEPAERPNFFIALNLSADTEQIGAATRADSLFNPRSQTFSDGRM